MGVCVCVCVKSQHSYSTYLSCDVIPTYLDVENFGQ